MGQIQNTSIQNMKYNIIKRYDQYSLVQINKTILVLREYNFVNQKQWQSSISKFQKAKKFKQEHILSLYHYESKKQQTLCSNFYKISVFYQYSDDNLFSQVETRKKQKKIFQENQLWSILYSCAVALAYLHDQKIPYGSLSLYDIILSNQGTIKINHPYNLTNYHKQLFKPDYFYSPEELIDKAHDPYKSDIFNLGLILLRCANFDKDLSFYDKETLNYNVLNQYIKYTSKKYSQHLTSVIEMMVKINAQQRPNWIQLQYLIMKLITKDTIPIKQKYKPRLSNKDILVQTKKPQTKIKTQILNPSFPQTLQYQNQINFESIADSEVLDQNSQKSQNHINQFHRFQSKYSQTNFLQPSQKINLPNPIDLNPNHQILAFVTQQYEGGKYEGYKLNKFRHGYGTFYYNQGGIYSGNWFQNKMHGTGILYYTSGKIAYQGDWNNDKLHGRGVLYNQQVQQLTGTFNYKNFNELQDFWVKYEGYFSQDNKSGFGKLTLSNGEYFEGYFSNDELNGEGKFYNKQNNIIKGIWNCNQLISFMND